MHISADSFIYIITSQHVLQYLHYSLTLHVELVVGRVLATASLHLPHFHVVVLGKAELASLALVHCLASSVLLIVQCAGENSDWC